MKHSIIFLFFSLLFTLTSCDAFLDYESVRTKVIKDNSVLILEEPYMKMKNYEVGDTIAVWRFHNTDWQIINGNKPEDETKFVEIDCSTFYEISYRNVIIESIGTRTARNLGR